MAVASLRRRAQRACGPDVQKISSGDVDAASVSRVAGAITPVPGGVGPMTVAMVVMNTVLAARQQSAGVKV